MTPPSGQNYFRSHFTAIKNDQNLHRVNTSYVTKVVEKQQILIVKNFQVSNRCVMGTIAQKQQVSGDFI
jgi:hypothetical protein